MNFLHLSLLAGLGAMAVPVALHLLSRRQPKLITFPALRLVKHTVVHQRGSWQLRHFLLLLLRVGLFGAMAIALARPRVHSAMLTAAVGLGLVVAAAIFASLVALTAAVTRRGAAVWMPVAIIALGLWTAAGIWTGISLTSGPVVPSSDQSAPVAAALIVDTGPSLDYRAENAKRFEAAKEMADWILGQLPLDSRVGILTGAPIGALSLDPATAKGQIHVLQPQAAHIDLPARLRTAIDLVQANSLERKEVYVITDLMRSSWAGATPDLPTLLKDQAREVLVQIIDVGTEQSTNWRLGEVETLSQVVPEGGDAEFRVSVSRSPNTPGASASVELYQEQIDPRLPIISNGQLKLPPSRVVDREIVDLTQAADAQVTLSAHSLTPGTHNFHIKLTIPDPLEIDNTRYITVVCQAQQAALVVSDDADNARFLRLALSPSAESDSPANLADTSLTQQVRYNQLAQVDLDRYRVVYLNDPPSLPPSTVSMLESHVKQGGGLFITLGPSIGSVDQAQASPLARLLPGKLARIGRRPQSDSS
ncbi:MAG: BatA domain-containing protein, partial [Aureliella sp.]